MRQVLKTILFLFLIAVLPFQGMAAVAAASCDSGSHESSLNARTENTFHRSAEQVALHHTRHVHDAEHAKITHIMSGAEAPDTSLANASPKHAFCGGLFTCCFGAAALPPFVFGTRQSTASTAVAISTFVFLSDHIPPSLERPPRQYLV